MVALVRDRARDKSAEYGTIEVVPRADFREEFGREYASGQHLTAMGPTGRGKSRLINRELLMKAASRDRKAVILHGKVSGRDPEVPEISEHTGMRVVHEWPPTKRFRDRDSRGYILVPLKRPGESVEQENAILHQNFRQAIHDNYADTKHDTITVVDESHQAQQTLKLRDDIEAPLMRGAPHNACWNLLQRGRWVSYLCYDAPEHIFIFYDSDSSNRQRYSEIAGVDPDYVMHVTERLKRYSVKRGATGKATISECLYIRHSGPDLMIVDIK
jgi:hypothetical protein